MGHGNGQEATDAEGSRERDGLENNRERNNQKSLKNTILTSNSFNA